MTSSRHRTLELLSPARDLETGKAAILAGADAVYIGAPSFGARAAVANSVKDIARLCEHAHLFGAKVYVTLNTILYEDEVREAVRLSHELYSIGVDALIIQDPALLRPDMPPIALHGSTQMHHVDEAMVRYWATQGLEQIVLARELSPGQIAAIHAAVPDVRLEAFIHGALCVSYSGRCYASASIDPRRSANRGRCSQVCRLPFDLVDGRGRVLVRDKHLLSLKDLDRSSILSDLIHAGVSSFKIEGRLKDLTYVRTVTAHYHRLLNEYISCHPSYSRSSYGTSQTLFDPDLSAIFHRGYTAFAHEGRLSDQLQSHDSPKSVGTAVGTVRRIAANKVYLTLLDGITLSNGDGFTYFDASGSVKGFRTNKALGDCLELSRVPEALCLGTTIYRNFDAAYVQTVANAPSQRRLPVFMRLDLEDDSLVLHASLREYSTEVSHRLPYKRQNARTPQSAILRECLSRLGETPYLLECLQMPEEMDQIFVPKSLLTRLRREVIEKLTAVVQQRNTPKDVLHAPSSAMQMPLTRLDYSWNVSNSYARKYYSTHGVSHISPAYELKPDPFVPVMTTKYCLRYALGKCSMLQGCDERMYEPWILLQRKRGMRFRLKFDCAHCRMLLYRDDTDR